MECFTISEMRMVNGQVREIEVCDVISLRKCLQEFSMEPPQVIVLQSPSGDNLMIGVGAPMATVHFQQASGNPPYLAVRGDTDVWNEFFEFDAGGTLTPLPVALCVPREKAVDVAVYFFLHKQLPEDVEWVEQ